MAATSSMVASRSDSMFSVEIMVPDAVVSEEFRENAAVHGVRHNVNAVNATLDGPQSIAEVVDVFVVDLFALNQGPALAGP